ncbi:MAG: YfcC family protein [Ruminococcaceae bacterium]|nr:YfcC family protein [Oscillospiraceae bacterium]
MAAVKERTKQTQKQESFSNISARSFLTVVLVLVAILIFCGVLSYFIPQGEFLRDENGIIITDSFTKGEIKGIAPWRIATAPIRVFATGDAITIIMISVFLLVMSGIFNLLEKTGGIKIFIARIIARLKNKGGPVVCITVFIFMLFGSLFGMFEELVTLLPIIIMFMLSMNMDTMTGLGACLLASCFGFSAAVTNPFSVGLVAQYAGVSASSGMWLRIVFFAIIYSLLCGFLMVYLKKIEQNPTFSLSYQTDLEKKENLNLLEDENAFGDQKVFRVYSAFFAVQAVVLVAIACIRTISGFAIPILAASFLILGVVAGFIVCKKPKDVAFYIIQGAVSMLPAVFLIAIASSVKLVMTESGIIDTIMYFVLSALVGKSKFLAVVLIYFLILFLQLFIGSASAKIVLIMPIIMPIALALGISPNIVILTYCMADGFTDVIMPTNPVLLIGLSMANVSYFKWVKWTWKLQFLVFIISLLILLFGVGIGY